MVEVAQKDGIDTFVIAPKPVLLGQLVEIVSMLLQTTMFYVTSYIPTSST